MVVRRALAGGLLVGLLLGAAGCATGSADAEGASATTPVASSSVPSPSPSLPSVGTAFSDAMTFALSSPSARLEGALTRGDGRVQVVLEGTAAGTDQQVVVDGGDDGVARVLTVGEGHWLAGDEDFWRARGVADADLAEATRTWLVVSGERARSLAPWTLRTLLAHAFDLPAVTALEGSGEPVTPDDVDGRAAWVLGSGEGPRLWVASDGSGELLRLAVPGEGTDVRFSRWGRAETFVAPGQYDVRRS